MNKKENNITLVIQDTSRKQYEVTISLDTNLCDIASEFFSEIYGEPSQQGSRPVAELIDPKNPDNTKRLDLNCTLKELGLWDGAVLIIFPESIAGCFLGDVNISLPNGQKKAIKKINIGDNILSYIAGSKQLSTAKVEMVFKNIANDYLILNKKLFITKSHPIWANDKWIKAEELIKGDLLQDRFGKKVELESVQHRNEKVKIYNLYVSNIEHTFFAEDLLVHNMNKKEYLSNLLENNIKNKISHTEYDSIQNLLSQITEQFDRQEQRIHLLEQESYYKLKHILGTESSGFSSDPNAIYLNPIFNKRNIVKKQNSCFVLMPFKKALSFVYTDHIMKICKHLNLTCVRADDIFNSSAIIEDIWENIYASSIIIADLTDRNPNVFYEVGIAHTIGKKVILIAQTSNDVPFDLQYLRYIVYDTTPRGMEIFEKKLIRTINNILKD